MVDELRGACLRAGAAEALLITTSAFSPTVYQHAASAPALAPVRLLDGEHLLYLLLHHRIGVQAQAGTSSMAPHLLHIEEAFFAELSRRYPGNRRRSKPVLSQPGEKPGKKAAHTPDATAEYPPENTAAGRRRGWRVTIHLGRPGRLDGWRAGGTEGRGTDNLRPGAPTPWSASTASGSWSAVTAFPFCQRALPPIPPPSDCWPPPPPSARFCRTWTPPNPRSSPSHRAEALPPLFCRPLSCTGRLGIAACCTPGWDCWASGCSSPGRCLPGGAQRLPWPCG